MLQKEQIVVRQGSLLYNVRHNTQPLTVISEALTHVALLLIYLCHEIAPEHVLWESLTQTIMFTLYPISHREYISPAVTLSPMRLP